MLHAGIALQAVHIAKGCELNANMEVISTLLLAWTFSLHGLKILTGFLTRRAARELCVSQMASKTLGTIHRVQGQSSLTEKQNRITRIETLLAIIPIDHHHDENRRKFAF